MSIMFGQDLLERDNEDCFSAGTAFPHRERHTSGHDGSASMQTEKQAEPLAEKKTDRLSERREEPRTSIQEECLVHSSSLLLSMSAVIPADGSNSG